MVAASLFLCICPLGPLLGMHIVPLHYWQVWVLVGDWDWCSGLKRVAIVADNLLFIFFKCDDYVCNL